MVKPTFNYSEPKKYIKKREVLKEIQICDGSDIEDELFLQKPEGATIEFDVRPEKYGDEYFLIQYKNKEVLNENYEKDLALYYERKKKYEKKLKAWEDEQKASEKKLKKEIEEKERREYERLKRKYG